MAGDPLGGFPKLVSEVTVESWVGLMVVRGFALPPKP